MPTKAGHVPHEKARVWPPAPCVDQMMMCIILDRQTSRTAEQVKSVLGGRMMGCESNGRAKCIKRLFGIELVVCLFTTVHQVIEKVGTYFGSKTRRGQIERACRRVTAIPLGYFLQEISAVLIPKN